MPIFVKLFRVLPWLTYWNQIKFHDTFLMLPEAGFEMKKRNRQIPRDWVVDILSTRGDSQVWIVSFVNAIGCAYGPDSRKKVRTNCGMPHIFVM
jgi:hypothetical protein